MNLETQWQEFSIKAVPETASDKQRKDMKTCFFCGAVALLSMIEAEAQVDPNGERINEFMMRVKDEMTEYIMALED